MQKPVMEQSSIYGGKTLLRFRGLFMVKFSDRLIRYCFWPIKILRGQAVENVS